MTATLKVTPLIGSEWRYTLGDKRAYLLDRTRRARGWLTVEGGSTGFDDGTRQHQTRADAEAHILRYLGAAA